MDLVDEDQHVAGPAQLVDQLLHALLELAAELRAGHQRRHVERIEPLAGNRVGHLARRDAQGQPLDDGTLAHSGLAQQHGVVLATAREDLHHALDLLLAADHGVDLTLAGLTGKVHAELVQQRLAAGGRTLVVAVQQMNLHVLAPQGVARREACHLGRHHLRVDAIHLQRLSRQGEPVLDDEAQGVGRPEMLLVGEPVAQPLHEAGEELAGKLLLRTAPVAHARFDLLVYLLQLPLLEAGGKYLIGHGSLLLEHGEGEIVAQMPRHAAFGGIEGRPGDKPL